MDQGLEYSSFGESDKGNSKDRGTGKGKGGKSKTKSKDKSSQASSPIAQDPNAWIT